MDWWQIAVSIWLVSGGLIYAYETLTNQIRFNALSALFVTVAVVPLLAFVCVCIVVEWAINRQVTSEF